MPMPPGEAPQEKQPTKGHPEGGQALSSQTSSPIVRLHHPETPGADAGKIAISTGLQASR
jgi:hypothetical protein